MTSTYIKYQVTDKTVQRYLQSLRNSGYCYLTNANLLNATQSKAAVKNKHRLLLLKKSLAQDLGRRTCKVTYHFLPVVSCAKKQIRVIINILTSNNAKKSQLNQISLTQNCNIKNKHLMTVFTCKLTIRIQIELLDIQ